MSSTKDNNSSTEDPVSTVERGVKKVVKQREGPKTSQLGRNHFVAAFTLTKVPSNSVAGKTKSTAALGIMHAEKMLKARKVALALCSQHPCLRTEEQDDHPKKGSHRFMESPVPPGVTAVREEDDDKETDDDDYDDKQPLFDDSHRNNQRRVLLVTPESRIQVAASLQAFRRVNSTRSIDSISTKATVTSRRGFLVREASLRSQFSAVSNTSSTCELALYNTHNSNTTKSKNRDEYEEEGRLKNYQPTASIFGDQGKFALPCIPRRTGVGSEGRKIRRGVSPKNSWYRPMLPPARPNNPVLKEMENGDRLTPSRASF
ncbi:expressed unknown protein [Seminavis robusta]|uniref:Uncharacterized protein n=1 Tax=Seminavis robusta TaxID=568900 RepID=A0A9N8DHT3_9STRA|nr:expressed unknown protein [Seminavis robusta]|eukprot:Sro134_g063550.1 n/a (317) ;mRNA; f:83487-84437